VGKIEKNTILWVKTITAPCKVASGSVMLILEDKNGDVISLGLYNHIVKHTSFN